MAKLNNKQLHKAIMDYWVKSISIPKRNNIDADYKVNTLLYDYALSHGIDEKELENDIDLTVSAMTATQKRELLKLLHDSNILTEKEISMSESELTEMVLARSKELNPTGKNNT